MKTLVVYFSRTGNNRLVANKLAHDLHADMEEIKPRVGGLLPVLLGLSFGIKPMEKHPNNYNQVVLVGPIWIGNFLGPMKSYVKKHKKDIAKLWFVTSCGSDEKNKDTKLGYQHVFKKVRRVAGDKLAGCFALSVSLTLSEEERNKENVPDIRLTEENFKGDILARYHEVVKAISGSMGSK